MDKTNGNQTENHTTQTFKSVVFGEATRLRRLIQRKEGYLSSLNRLKEKAILSNFPLAMTNDMIAMASNWEERLRAPNGDKKNDPQVWATSFPHLITLTEREKKLYPKAMMTYKRPTTIGQLLTNYKHLALSKTREHAKALSGPCGHCALCGDYGKHNKSMVPCVLQIMSKTKAFPHNQNLTCAKYGIYVATCVIFHERYVDQRQKEQIFPEMVIAPQWLEQNQLWNWWK